MINIEISEESIDRIECDALLVNFFSDEIPLKKATGLIDWRLNGLLSKLIIRKKIFGYRNEFTLIPTLGRLKSKYVLLAGLGNSTDHSTFELLPKLIFEKMTSLQCFSLGIPMSRFSNLHYWNEDVFHHFLQDLNLLFQKNDTNSRVFKVIVCEVPINHRIRFPGMKQNNPQPQLTIESLLN